MAPDFVWGRRRTPGPSAVSRLLVGGDGAPSRAARAARALDVACAIAVAAAAAAAVELVTAVESEGTTKVRTRPATALVPALGGGSRGITGAGAGSAAVASNAA